MSGGAASAGYYSALMNPLLSLRNASPVSGTGSIGQMGGGAGGGVSPLAMLLAAHIMQGGGGPMAGQAPQPQPQQQPNTLQQGMSGLNNMAGLMAKAPQSAAPTYTPGQGALADPFSGFSGIGPWMSGSGAYYNQPGMSTPSDAAAMLGLPDYAAPMS